MYDVIVVPGGGLEADGTVRPWVRNRLDRALELSGTAPILCLSAGTPHKPPPLDDTGHPVFESVAAARYLLSRSMEPSRVLLETASYETIGNAYFARVMHTDQRNWRRLLVVNSAFHMPRTEAVFRWVFGLLPDRGYEIAFEIVPNIGMAEADLQFRCAREKSSLERVRELEGRIRAMHELHQFLFTEHLAYAVHGTLESRKQSPEMERVY